MKGRDKMREWRERPAEIQNLYNPAFCGRILYSMVVEYQKKTNRALPFSLIYLVLPLVLPKQIRERITSRTQFINWVQSNQAIIFDYPSRARALIDITNEAFELTIQTNLLRITEMGEIERNTSIKPLSQTKYTDDEIKDCIKKAEHVARWFAITGKPEAIYYCLGVRP